MATLNKDVAFTWEGHNVRAKAGAKLLVVKDGYGRGTTGYALIPATTETDSPRGPGSLWEHDNKYRYIYVKKDDVTV